MITASLVLFNTPKIQIDTIIASYAPSKERRLFIIDNSPSDNLYCHEIVDSYIEYLHNNNNIGYGSAHNIGIKKAIELKSDYHLVLNPDLEFKPEIIDNLISYANDNRDVVYILPKVLYPDGEIQYLCKLLPTPFDLIFRRFLPPVGPINMMNDRYELKMSGYDKIINPPCLSGCFMFMRTKVLERNELFFDDRFFMYCEDFDLMRRLHRYGKTVFYPEVSIIHNHAKSSYKSKKMLMEHMKSACIYFGKYGWFFDKERKEQNRIILKEIRDLT